MTGVDARGPQRPRSAQRALPSPADGDGSATTREADGDTAAAGSAEGERAGIPEPSAGRGAGYGTAPGWWLIPVIPGLLGLFTGAYHLGRPPLWRDEAATKAIASRPVREIVATMPHDDVVHFAYYLVVHFVIRILGSQNGSLRLPSVLAMAVAAAFTALVAQRLAASGGRWYAACTGLVAGVVFAVLPPVIRYAQEARSYAIVTMLAAIATYLLLCALDDGRRRWWAAYGIAVFLAGLFNIFGLLIVVAHGLTLLAVGRPGTGAGRTGGTGGTGGTWSTAPADRAASAGRRLAGVPLAWLIASGIAAVLLIPLGIMAYAQRGALSWMSAVPAVKSLAALTHLWAGSPTLAWPVFGLAVLGVAASLIAERRAPSPATVALPWLVAPPAILLAASVRHPVYDVRYVEFCLPALAICVASGITWLWRAIGTAFPSVRRSADLSLLAAAPALAAAGVLIVALQPSDAVVREPGYRPDNLENEAAIIAANARQGDIVFFIPINDRIVSMAFPKSWRELRDIALAKSPAASDTLYGTDVSPAVLASRFTDVKRVWVISSAVTPLTTYLASPQATPVDREELTLIAGMHVRHRWRDGDTELTLYKIPSVPRS